jgi:hypothetical protein
MQAWDREAFELLGPAFFAFGRGRVGEFRFIAVEGQMNCRYDDRDGKPLVEFTWEGSDELDPVNGDGWAVIDGAAMRGRIVIHQGEESGFTAVRWPAVTRSARR